MDDVLGMIVVFAIYLISAFSGKKKGKRTKRVPMRSRARGEQQDRRAEARDRQTFQGFEDAFAQRENDAQKTAPREEVHPQQMHLHDVTQTQLANALEGEDPCHAGGDGRQAELPDWLPSDEETPLAQDVLRGVIMSEILTRPCERNTRAAMQRGRR